MLFNFSSCSIFIIFVCWMHKKGKTEALPFILDISSLVVVTTYTVNVSVI